MMTITKVEIRMASTGDVLTTIESLGLVNITGDPAVDSEAMQDLESRLRELFSELHGCEDLDIVFPELE
jgi:hypothetical protein